MVEPLRDMIGALAVRERLSFRLAWLISSTQLHLTARSALHTLPPSGPGAALRYSVMLRPPPHIVAAMASDLERLREISPHHYYYPSDSMHVTIGGAGRFLNDGYRAATRFAELHAIIGSYPSFDITLRGLNVSPFTVFAQVIPHSRTLRGLRKEFRMLSRPLSRASAFGDYVQGLLPHVNIVRFSERVAPDFLNEVSRFREEWFGRWTVREVEVMRADRLLSSEGRQVLERIPLAPIHPTS